MKTPYSVILEAIENNTQIFGVFSAHVISVSGTPEDFEAWIKYHRAPHINATLLVNEQNGSYSMRVKSDSFDDINKDKWSREELVNYLEGGILTPEFISLNTVPTLAAIANDKIIKQRITNLKP